jgi:hypothetical protein
MEHKNNITLNKVLLYIGISIFILGNLYAIITSYFINNYGTYIYGNITNISNYGSKSMFVYQFALKEKHFEGTATVSVYEKYHHEVGDSCLIKYYTKNPNWSRLIKNKEELKIYYDSKIIIEE